MNRVCASRSTSPSSWARTVAVRASAVSKAISPTASPRRKVENWTSLDPSCGVPKMPNRPLLITYRPSGGSPWRHRVSPARTAIGSRYAATLASRTRSKPANKGRLASSSAYSALSMPAHESRSSPASLGSSGLNRDAKPPLAGVAGCDQRDARFVNERPFEVELARVALPRLDAQEGSTRHHPQAHMWTVRKIDTQTQCPRRAEGDPSAVEPIEDDRQFFEQLVARAQNVAVNRGRPAFRVQPHRIAGPAADRRRFVGAKDNGVLAFGVSGCQRPVESGMETDIGR